MAHLTRLCPICNNNEGDVLHTQHFSLPAQSILPNQYDVVSCSSCGFCFADTKATQDIYDQYYNQMSKYEDKETASGGALDGIDKLRLDTAAKIIEKHCTDKTVSILDIGCANGGLLMCLKERGFSNMTGIDITPVCVNNVKQLGFQAEFGGLFNLENLGNKKYDVVIISHVLEHVRDLKHAAKNLVNLLHENGILYIEVPDASRYPNYFVVPFYYFDCEHINHLDADSLTNLFNNTSRIDVNEREIKVSETTPYPAVSVIFRKTNDKKATPTIISSDKVRKSIEKFIELSKQKTDYSNLEKLIISKERIMVWGAGMYTLRLLQNSPLEKCNIVSFLDKDSKKQGNKISNIYISEPFTMLVNEPNTTVIIASALHGNEILSEIRNSDGHSNRNVLIL